jgi:hypothetical protein
MSFGWKEGRKKGHGRKVRRRNFRKTDNAR